MSAAAATPAHMREEIALPLIWATQDTESAAVLHEMFCKRRPESRQGRALLDGHVAIKVQSYRAVRDLRDLGGLLHFGQPAAITAAKAMQWQRQGGAA